MKNNYNYDMNIENTRASNNTNMDMNQNPYITQATNINPMNNQQVNQQINPQANPVSNSGFSNGDFVKGALIGAAVTYLLTNKDAQKTIMKAASKGSEFFQAGMEEIKERYEDARAQMEANRE